MNELCFVWGPPCSGQLRWMMRSAEQSEAGTDVSLAPLLDCQKGLEECLDQTQAHLRRLQKQTRPQHLYVELPWQVISESLELDEWLSRCPELRSDWNLSFMGLCPFDAERLPAPNRSGLEEFSRSSMSAIVVPTPREGLEPVWFGTESLDFGRRVEVYEECLWPRAADKVYPSLKFFGDSEELEFFTLPARANPDHLSRVLGELSSELEKGLWGADLVWALDDSQVQFLSLHSGQWRAWSGPAKYWIDPLVPGQARLMVSGQPISKKEIVQMLQSQSLN
jgi:hypothetical protein